MDYAKPQRLCVGAMAHIISKRKVADSEEIYMATKSWGSWLMCCWWRGEGTDHQT